MKKILALLFCILFSQILFADVSIQTDTLKLVINEYAGNICLYSKNEDGRFKALVDSKQFANSPSFYVNINGLVYPVNAINGFDISATTSSDGTEAVFTASLKDIVKISIKYSFFATEKGGKVDSVRMSPSIVSLSDEKIEVGLKSIFDTFLGENTKKHFSCIMNPIIDSEYMTTSVSSNSWFQSKNDENSLTFIIPQSQNTLMDRVIIAGKTQLFNNTWNYNYSKGRSFNSINLYNNSSIAFMWDTVTVGQNPHNMFELYMYTGLEDFKESKLVTQDISDVYINSLVTETAGNRLSTIESIILTAQAAEKGDITLTEAQLLTLLNTSDEIIYDAKGAVLVAQSTDDEILLMQSLIDLITKMKNENTQATYEEIVALNLLLDQMLEKAEW